MIRKKLEIQKQIKTITLQNYTFHNHYIYTNRNILNIQRYIIHKVAYFFYLNIFFLFKHI